MRWHFHAIQGTEALAARRRFVDFLQRLRVQQSDRDCGEIVFGELVGNAVRHAPGPVDITAYVDRADRIVLEICDTGPNFELSPGPPPLHSEGGRGLYIVTLLTSDLRSVHTGFGNRVTAVLPMTGPVDNTSHDEAAS
jgi:anti-sigma regulatory factor (Ser/Thr protein kinase)